MVPKTSLGQSETQRNLFSDSRSEKGFLFSYFSYLQSTNVFLFFYSFLCPWTLFSVCLIFTTTKSAAQIFRAETIARGRRSEPTCHCQLEYLSNFNVSLNFLRSKLTEKFQQNCIARKLENVTMCEHSVLYFPIIFYVFSCTYCLFTYILFISHLLNS